MRRLNVRLLASLVALVLILGGGLFALHRFQSRRIAQAVLFQAQRAEADGDLPRAVTYRMRYLEFAPDDADQRAELGLMLAGDGFGGSRKAREQAYFNLDKVARQRPERKDVRGTLARVAMELKRFDLASEHLNALLASSPDDAAAEALRGQWYEAQSQYADAATWLRKAIGHAPHDVDSYLRLARILREHSEARTPGPLGDADRVLDDMVARNPDSYGAYLGRFRARVQAGLNDAAAKTRARADVQRALALAPNDIEVLLAAAGFAQGEGQLAEAMEDTERALAADPKDPRAYRVKARIQLQEGARDKAVATYRRGAEAVRPADRAIVLWDLANLLLDGNDVAGGTAALAELRDAGLDQAHADYLSGRVQAAQRQWAKAAQAFERARPGLESDRQLAARADAYLAQCYDQLDAPAAKLAAYKRLLARDPAGAAAYAGLGAALTAAGRGDEAVAAYRQLMKLPGAPASGWCDLARLLLPRASRDPADWSEANEALRKARQAMPTSPEPLILQSELEVARGHIKSAEDVLKEARDRFPADGRVWAASASLADRQANPQAAEAFLNEGKQRAGDSANIRVAWAVHWATRGGTGAKEALDRLASDLDHLSGADRSRVLQAVATAFERLGDPARAAAAWERAADAPERDTDLRLQRHLLELAVARGDAAAADRALSRIDAIEGGDGPLWHFGQALRLLAFGGAKDAHRLDEAWGHLEAAAARRPDWPVVVAAKGDVEALRGDSDQAVALYRSALSMGDRDPRLARRLVETLVSRQRYAEADQELRHLQEREPVEPALARLGAEVALRVHDKARAVELARLAARPDSENGAECLWLGQILSAAGQRAEEADQLLRRACQLLPKEPGAWLALARHLAGAGRKADAAAVVEQARAKLPPETADLAIAQIQEATGRTDEAAAAFKAASDRHPSDPAVLKEVASFDLRAGRPAEAEPVLRRILNSVKKASESDRAWARRSLALVLAGSGNYERCVKALELLGLRVAGDGEVTESPGASAAADEQRYRARALSLQPLKPFRTKAISLYEDARKHEALDEGDFSRLAQLQEANGNWAAAREIWRSGLASWLRGPLALQQAGLAFLRHGDTELAQQCATLLEQAEHDQGAVPGSLGSAELKARVLEARGQADEALAFLKAYAGRPNAAPEDTLLVVSLLGRQRRTAEAVDAAEKVWNKCAPEKAAAACLGAVVAAPADKPQAARVEAWLQGVLRAKPDDVPLLLDLAALKDVTGDDAGAEQAYRLVLAREPANLTALNNLAWLVGHRRGGGDEALALLSRALDAHGPRTELLDTRGVVFLELGRFEPAVTELTRVCADAPNHGRLIHLARARLAAGDRAGALAAWKQAKAGLDPSTLGRADRSDYLALASEFDKK